ncbi:MAG: ROK family protein [Lentisphaeria bacterium]|nr:ROK family protein [Lentisphaeria bacterium]
MNNGEKEALILIRRGTIRSRAELARTLGISRPTASVIVDSLLKNSFIREAGRGRSTGGKAPTLLSVLPETNHILGLDLGYKSMLSAVLIDGAGTIIQKKEYEFDPASMENIGETSLAALRELASSHTVNGAGVALSGIVEKNTGKVLKSINPLFTGNKIREYLSNKLALPVHVENRSRMAAYSEAYGGAADQEKDFALISLGRSIGAAFWLNGQLFTGQSEIRNLRLKKKKTFEEALSPSSTASSSPEEIISCCADGLGQLLEIMGIERIVLSGRFADMGKDFAFRLEKALSKEHICKVDMAKFGRFSAARGAAFLQGERIL